MMKALLIGGGGTLGTYTSEELLRLGCEVDVIALEALTSDDPRLRYIRASVDDAYLADFLGQRRYDVIVDFIHYPDPAAYERRMPLLLDRAGRLVFLSSYRVYADCEHPIRETSPQLLDACEGDDFLFRHDTYGLSKSREERLLRACGRTNWTIVRPLISFSHFRFDLVTQGAGTLLTRPPLGKPILLPEGSRSLTAGLTWAGNTGKMIARLALSDSARGEAFTLGAGETNTWEDVARFYTALNGARFEWVDTETYLQYATLNGPGDQVILRYDRLFDRRVDNAKVLAATGLTAADFLPVRDALARELKCAAQPDERLGRVLNSEGAREINRRMDAYFTR